MKKAKEIINKAEQLIVFLTVFLIPLFFAFILRTNNAFELNKIVVFRVLVIVLLFIFFAKTLFKRQAAISFYKNKLLNCLIVILFIGSLVLRALFSIDAPTSFFGQYDKQEGLYSYIFYIIFFLLLINFFQNKKNIKKILGAGVLSSFFVSLYAILQSRGIDIFEWSESITLRVTSTLGQPNHLASYLLLVIPFSVYLFFQTKSKFLKLFLFIVFLSQVAAFFYTRSMAAWLALALAVLLLAVIHLFYSYKKIKNKHKIVAVIILFLMVFSGWLAFKSDFCPRVVENKIANITNFNTGSTAARLQFWQAAWEAIKERPMIGYGLDAQQEVLAGQYKKDWAIHSNVNVRPARAHNWLLDSLLAGGVLGLIPRVFIWAGLFYALFKNIKNSREKALNYPIFISLSAYFIYLQFNYHHVSALVYFSALAAMVYCLYSRKQARQEDIGIEKPRKGKKIFLFILFIFASGGIFYIINYEFKKIAADHYFFELRRSANFNQYFSLLKMYDFIKDSGVNNAYYEKEAGLILSGLLDAYDNKAFRQKGDEYLKQIAEGLQSDNFSSALSKSRIYASLSINYKEYEDRARQEFNKLISFSPEMPLAHRYYADFLLQAKDYDKAIMEYDSALSYLPSLGSSGLNKAHEFALKKELDLNYQGLINAYEAIGEDEKKKEYVEKKKLLIGQ